MKEFVLIDSCPYGPGFHEDRYTRFANVGLPKLRALFIEGSPNWPINVATHLTVFKLKGTMSLELGTLAEFLRRNTSLSSLELTGLTLWKSSGWHREALIELPHLYKLSIRDATCGCALALLRLPSLKRLRVSSSGGQDPWRYTPWANLCSRLLVTSLEAHHRSSERDGITVVGWSNGQDTHSLRFTEFNSPTVLGAALFGSLSNTSLSSVTSLSLIKHMPEGCMSSSLIAAICDLLRYLPQVERMRLRPSQLVVKVIRRLSGDQKLCPELRELAIRITAEASKPVLRLLTEMKARADGDSGRRMITVKLLSGNGGADTFWS